MKERETLTQAAGGRKALAVVAHCTATTCGYNDRGDCHAPNGISVRLDGNHADCETFTLNEHQPSAGAHP